MVDLDALTRWMRETGWWKAGPCVVCGGRDYPLSMGGPGVCPYCDLHSDGKRLSPYKRGMRTVDQIRREFEYYMKLAVEQGIMIPEVFSLFNGEERGGGEGARDSD